MEFPVKWDLERLGHEENLTEEIKAAESLERRGYRACIVGDLASVVYGSDVVVNDVYIAAATVYYSLLSKRFLNPASQKNLKHNSDSYRLHQQRIAVQAGPDIDCGMDRSKMM
jgi:hypothetical protein